jgi:hypothetical protein
MYYLPAHHSGSKHTLYTLVEPEKFLPQAGVTESSILFVVAGCSSDYNDKWFPVARSFVKGENPKLGTKKALESL